MKRIMSSAIEDINNQKAHVLICGWSLPGNWIS